VRVIVHYATFHRHQSSNMCLILLSALTNSLASLPQISFHFRSPRVVVDCESHPSFVDILKASNAFGITPNYTTNGMWVRDPRCGILAATKELCGGVAVSTHPHLEKYWREAVELYLSENIHTNLHVIIGDRKSIDTFAELYREFSGRIKYFVLLPLAAQGRSTEEFSDWDYLKSKNILLHLVKNN
jgi:hypothetical protein